MILIMKIRFQKYQGTGNDFIIVDNRGHVLPSIDLKLVKHLCDRKFGIGSDGIILFENDENSDFNMNFFNPDGSQSFCGNGSRCVIQYAIDIGVIEGKAKFRAIDGMHEGYKKGDLIFIKMKNVSDIEYLEDHTVLDTGSPHYVTHVNNMDELNIIERARQIRYSKKFNEKGINVNFVETIPTGIKMRTYERGVEGETLSCGTGVTAAALSHALRNGSGSEVNVETKGGSLKVMFEKVGDGFQDIWLCGPAKKVYKGEIEIDA